MGRRCRAEKAHRAPYTATPETAEKCCCNR